MRFGEKIKEERKKQNISTQTLAQACEISRSYLTLIENGKRLPGKKILPRLASALGLDTTVVLNLYLEEVREKLTPS
jgi:transcriptional regulator with XRE-family HTH domain